VKAVPVDETPAAEREDLHCCAVSVRSDPDHVHGPDRALVRGLPLGQMANGVETVSAPRRLLEALGVGGGPHLLLQAADDRIRLPGEELDHAVDDRAVRLGRDVADAGREAALDVVVEAGNARVAAGLRALAGPVGKDAVQDVERLTHLLRVRVRPEVDDAATVPFAREHDARVLVLDGDGDVGVRLVVAETDVEGRPVTADEVLLEVEGLGLVPRRDHLEALDPLRELLHPEPRVPGPEVGADARTKRFRLADVEHGVPRVPEEVDAGLRRQRLQLRLDALLT
jgi:hypothetical protein